MEVRPTLLAKMIDAIMAVEESQLKFIYAEIDEMKKIRTKL